MAMVDLGLVVRDPSGTEASAQAWVVLLAPVFVTFGVWAAIGIVRLRRQMVAFAAGLRPIVDLAPGDGLVALSGTVVADVSAVSAVTRLACVYCEYSVEEHWEREYETATADHPSIHSGTTVVANGAYAVPFFLDDGSGRILVEPERARVVGTTTFDDRVRRDSDIYWVDGVPELDYSAGLREIEERIIEVGETVTVTGRVAAGQDEPVIRSPRSRLRRKDTSFTITAEDAARVARARRRSLRRRYVVGVGCAIGLAAVLVVGVPAIA